MVWQRGNSVYSMVHGPMNDDDSYDYDYDYDLCFFSALGSLRF